MGTYYLSLDTGPPGRVLLKGRQELGGGGGGGYYKYEYVLCCFLTSGRFIFVSYSQVIGCVPQTEK